jgi:hypothetical protein
MKRLMLIGAAALCALTMMTAPPAGAMPLAPLSPAATQAGVDIIQVRGGHGHGHGHMGRGGRGHHYGWSLGRHRGRH